MDDVQLISQDLIDSLRVRAAASPRLRINHNFHSSPQDNPHRFLNVMLRGTYVQPHRHRNPPKAESWILMEGTVRLFTFDDQGVVTDSWLLSSSGPLRGIDVAPGLWHTVCVVDDWAVVYEVKPGPWDPTTDKEFAVWAPAEGESCIEAYLDYLLSHP
ncbi:WbuC family cupin fold metalloprotein [uncultured Paludibaculum sp.]|uniref:WbuC family cupin fold metalloprotein n=1 Tax=uncultured Paludibaculum sp. TaxID=1765020 RepID=UPI002AAA6333|nr:WbuC family cupin fold metalloprotein [uncultured Paludibaculum sp.]